MIEKISDEIEKIFLEIREEAIEKENYSDANLIEQLMYVACGIVERIGEEREVK